MQIFVSHKFKFIYVRQQKSSSSTIITAITRTFCGDIGVCTDDEFKRELNPNNRISQEQWREYFVFTWVRNPWVRMESSYRFLCGKFLRVKDENDRPGDKCCPSFDDFSTNPYVLNTTCYTESCCPWNQYSSPQVWDYYFVAGHLKDQAHITFAPNGDSLVDFIGRTENTEEDWAALLTHINKRTGYHYKPQEVERQNPTPDDGSGDYVPCLGRSVVHLDRPTMLNLAKVFAMDVLRFGFDAPPTGVEE